jgi:hypothetical protein
MPEKFPGRAPDRNPDASGKVWPGSIDDPARPLQRRHHLAALDDIDRFQGAVRHPDGRANGHAGAPTLIRFSVVVAFEVSVRDARAIGKDEAARVVGRVNAQLGIDRLGALERLVEFNAGAPYHQTYGIGAILRGMQRPLADHGLGLATSPSATEETFEHRTIDERGLRTRLRAPRGQ